jgi:hypothetical protein
MSARGLWRSSLPLVVAFAAASAGCPADKKGSPVNPGTGGVMAPPPAGGAGGPGGAGGGAGMPVAPPPANDAVWNSYEQRPRSPVLPVVFVDLGGRSATIDRVKLPARLKIVVDHDGSHRDLATRRPVFESVVGISMRGSSSTQFPQKAYTVELWDDMGFERKAPLLDMPSGEDWALVSCWTDKPCMRNALAYAMGRQTGRWNPRARFVELYLDQRYHGLYQLVEAIRQDKARVAIERPAESGDMGGDLTGGYIVRREGGGKGEPTTRPMPDWVSPVTHPDGEWKTVFTYHYPKEDRVSEAQKKYLEDYFARFEEMMKGPDWKDPQKGYRKWIDVQSFVDYLLVNEVTNNADGNFKSLYLVKESDRKGGKLSLGPLWDYNIAFANVDYREGWKIDILTYKHNRFGGICSRHLPARSSGKCGGNCQHSEGKPPVLDCWNVPYVPFWIEKLFTDEAFVNELRCRWRALRQGGAFDVDRIALQIEAWRRELAPAALRHFTRWQGLLTAVWPNFYVSSNSGELEAFFNDEVDFLRGWTVNRIKWLDANLPGVCGS